MRLDDLNKHFELAGISSIDLDGVYEIRLAGVDQAVLRTLVTVGDLMALLISHSTNQG